MWRAGKAYRLQTDSADKAGREVDGGNRGACVSRNWGPTSCAAAGDLDYAIDRNGDCIQAGGNQGAGAVCARAKNVPAPGRSANFECRGGAGADPAASYSLFRSRCSFVWRDEERIDGSRGGGVLSSGTGGELSVCAQAGDATGIEDARSE